MRSPYVVVVVRGGGVKLESTQRLSSSSSGELIIRGGKLRVK